MEQRGRAAEEYQSSQEENYNRIIKTFDQYCELSLKINNDNNNNRCVLCSREYTKQCKSTIIFT